MSTAPGWDDILHDGEEILWQGRPDPAFHVTGGQILEAVFGLCFALFALVWISLAARAPGGVWMFGLIHSAVGAGLAFHGLVWPTFLRRHTWYTLSADRAFIATDIPIRGRSLDSYAIGPSTAISLEDGAPGSVWFAHRYRRTRKGSRRVTIGFERIGEAREVMKLMTGIQRSQHARPQ